MAQKQADNETRWRQLIADAQKGNNESYQTLLLELDTFLRRYCGAIIKNWSKNEDLSQECLVAIHKARMTYDPARPFLPWVKAIVRNKSIDWIRKEVKQIEREILIDETKAQGSTKDLDSTENNIVFENLIKLLDEKYQQPILLTKIYGYTEKEVGKKLNLSESAVKIRIHRGVMDLKNVVKKDFEKNLKNNTYFATFFILSTYIIKL